jgi:hypothetical protein
MKTTYLFFAFALIAIAVSCNKTAEFTPECDGSTPTYDADISLIIQQSCTPCHASGGSNDNYMTYSNMSSIISNGKFEKEVLTQQSMPQNSSLTEAQLNKIKCWVENGYPEN